MLTQAGNWSKRDINKEEHERKMQRESIKPKLDVLKRNFNVACEAFEHIISKDTAQGSAKRQLDMVLEQLLGVESILKETTEPINFCYTSYQNRLSEYEVTFASLMNSLAIQIEDLRTTALDTIEDGLRKAMDVAKENVELKVLLKKEKEEVMHQQQNHNYAITEKNTMLATCRKLEEQLEEKNKQIQQLQKQGTVTLWNREKTKLIREIKSNEETLGNQLEKAQYDALETKDRLQRRIVKLVDQVKFLKLEKELGGKAIPSIKQNDRFSKVKTPTPDDDNSLKQQIYRKDRALVMAEAEIQKQQKYFIGFINGLKRDFTIMLERQGIYVEKYSKDQKAYMNMLCRLYTAATEGMLSELKARLPSHYQGVNQEGLRHPLGKKLTRSMSQLEKEYIELERNGSIHDPLLAKPTFRSWRDAKTSTNSTQETYGVHPELVDKKSGTPLVHEAAKYFPEWSEDDIKDIFTQFQTFDKNRDYSLDSEELLEAIPDILGKMTTTEEIAEAMAEVDTDHSGTVDFFEFLSVARLITQQQGQSAIFKKKRLTALQKSSEINSRVCVIQ